MSRFSSFLLYIGNALMGSFARAVGRRTRKRPNGTRAACSGGACRAFHDARSGTRNTRHTPRSAAEHTTHATEHTTHRTGTTPRNTRRAQRNTEQGAEWNTQHAQRPATPDTQQTRPRARGTSAQRTQAEHAARATHPRSGERGEYREDGLRSAINIPRYLTRGAPYGILFIWTGNTSTGTRAAPVDRNTT